MRKAIFKQTEMTANNDIYTGESIEEYCHRATVTKQPIEGGAPIIYTPRKDGVRPEFDIRTDRFALAQKSMDKVSKSILAKRTEYLESQEPTKKTEQEPTKETA